MIRGCNDLSLSLSLSLSLLANMNNNFLYFPPVPQSRPLSAHWPFPLLQITERKKSHSQQLLESFSLNGARNSRLLGTSEREREKWVDLHFTVCSVSFFLGFLLGEMQQQSYKNRWFGSLDSFYRVGKKKGEKRDNSDTRKRCRKNFFVWIMAQFTIRDYDKKRIRGVSWIFLRKGKNRYRKSFLLLKALSN